MHCHLWITQIIHKCFQWIINIWIVRMTHVDSNGEYSSLTSTMNVIRTQWSTDIHIEGIHAFFIHSCINFCVICWDVKIWDEIMTWCFQVILDTLCMKHIVFKRRYKCPDGQQTIMSLYCCHRGGNKIPCS